MDFEVSYDLDNAEQFWEGEPCMSVLLCCVDVCVDWANDDARWIELDDIVSTRCQTHETIDNALRSYLSFTTKYRGV